MDTGCRILVAWVRTHQISVHLKAMIRWETSKMKHNSGFFWHTMATRVPLSSFQTSWQRKTPWYLVAIHMYSVNSAELRCLVSLYSHLWTWIKFKSHPALDHHCHLTCLETALLMVVNLNAGYICKHLEQVYMYEKNIKSCKVKHLKLSIANQHTSQHTW